MYRDSVNLSITHYSRRNSIADAYMKPVFVITCARIDLFPDETYFTLFICATHRLSFICLLCSSPRNNCFYFLLFSPTIAEVCRLFLHHIYLIGIYSYHSHVAFAQKSIMSSLWHTFVAIPDHILPERNINETLFENVRQLLFIIVFIRSVL